MHFINHIPALIKKSCQNGTSEELFSPKSSLLTLPFSRFVMWPSLTSLTDADDVEDGHQMVEQILQWPGKWNGHTVGLRLLEIKGRI